MTIFLKKLFTQKLFLQRQKSEIEAKHDKLIENIKKEKKQQEDLQKRIDELQVKQTKFWKIKFLPNDL